MNSIDLHVYEDRIPMKLYVSNYSTRRGKLGLLSTIWEPIVQNGNEYGGPPRSFLRNIENSRGQALEGREGGISNLLRGGERRELG